MRTRMFYPLALVLSALALWVGGASLDATRAQADDVVATAPTEGEVTRVRGVPEGPRAMYTLMRNRRAAEHRPSELRQSFVRSVEAPVRRAPF